MPQRSDWAKAMCTLIKRWLLYMFINTYKRANRKPRQIILLMKSTLLTIIKLRNINKIKQNQVDNKTFTWYSEHAYLGSLLQTNWRVKLIWRSWPNVEPHIAYCQTLYSYIKIINLLNKISDYKTVCNLLVKVLNNYNS